MGAVLVWLAERAKLIAAWTMILGAWALLVNAVFHSAAFSSISSGFSSALSMLVSAASLVPSSVSSIHTAISQSLEDDGFPALMYWLCGFDMVLSMVSFISAQVSGIVTMVVGLGTSSLALYSLVWTFRQTSRLANVIGGSVHGASPVN